MAYHPARSDKSRVRTLLRFPVIGVQSGVGLLPFSVKTRFPIGLSQLGRWCLLVAVTVSLVQLPLPVIHAHDLEFGDSLVDAGTVSHVQRRHGADSPDATANQRHLHFVLPDELNHESGSEIPVSPDAAANSAATSVSPTVSLSAAENPLERMAVVPVVSALVSGRAADAPPPRQYLSSFDTLIPRVALLGVARL